MNFNQICRFQVIYNKGAEIVQTMNSDPGLGEYKINENCDFILF